MRSVVYALTRRPVLSVLVGAFLLRAIAAVAITVMTDGVVAPDEAIFRWMAATVASGDAVEGAYRPTYVVTRFYVRLLATGYELFGPHLIVGRLMAAAFGAGVAASTVAVVRPLAGDRAGIVAGGIVALFPSQIFFSAQTLKDPLVWLLVATIALAASRAASLGRKEALACLAIVAAALALVGMVRAQTAAVVAIAIALSGPMQGQGWERAARGIAASGVAVVVPWLVGLGPLARRIVSQASETAAIRRRHALEGETGFARPDADLAEQIGTGLRAYLVEPVPWGPSTASWEPLAQAEMLLWYPVLLAALLGLWTARRHSAKLAFAVLYGCGTVLVYVLAEGDLMTAYRHRGEIVWVAAVLVAVGAERWLRPEGTSP